MKMKKGSHKGELHSKNRMQVEPDAGGRNARNTEKKDSQREIRPDRSSAFDHARLSRVVHRIGGQTDSTLEIQT